MSFPWLSSGRKNYTTTNHNDDVSRERNGASGAENLPPPSPRITSSPFAASSPHVPPTLFVHSSIRLVVWLVGCCVVSLPLVVTLPVPLRRHAMPCRCAASRLSLSLSSRCCWVVVSSRLVSPRPSPLVTRRRRWCPCCSSSSHGLSLLGDVYECICFGLVTVKECVNFRLVTCHRTVLKFGKK